MDAIGTPLTQVKELNATIQVNNCSFILRVVTWSSPAFHASWHDRRRKRGSVVHYDLAKHHYCPSHQKGRPVTAALHSRYQPGLFPDRASPLLSGGIDSLRHHGGNGDLANCECGRIHKALPIVDLNSSSGDWRANSEQIACGRVLCYNLRQW